MSDTKIDLKPCPWCGEEKAYLECEGLIVCPCGISLLRKTNKEAIKKWNQRAYMYRSALGISKEKLK